MKEHPMSADDNTNLASRIISASSEADRARLDALLPEVYDHLREIARMMLKRERSTTTIQATSLVNEAYARMVTGAGVAANDRMHLLRLLAQRMRWILIERARRPKIDKAGDMDVEIVPDGQERDAASLEALDRAVRKLRERNPVAADVVDARVHLQWTEQQIADEFGIGEATVRRKWAFAKAWLRTEIEGVGTGAMEELA
jgi:RNA polymerase sigma factor (TIGR02999 family)